MTYGRSPLGIGGAYNPAEWYLSDIDLAHRARDQAAQEHNDASANYARVAAISGVAGVNVYNAGQRMTNARSALYEADAKLAALVRDADVKAKIEEVEEIKRSTLASIEASVDILEKDGLSEIVLEWDFDLDDKAEEYLVRSLKAVLHSYRARVAAS